MSQFKLEKFFIYKLKIGDPPLKFSMLSSPAPHETIRRLHLNWRNSFLFW